MSHISLTDRAAVKPSTNGFITIHRCNQPRPLASNLNYTPGTNGGNDIITGLHIPPDGTPSHICIYNSSPTHLTADVTNYTTIA